MNQRVYFSDVGEPDLWSTKHGRHYLSDAARIVPWLTWDATPDLAQATWEWPPRYRMHFVERTPEGVWWELR